MMPSWKDCRKRVNFCLLTVLHMAWRRQHYVGMAIVLIIGTWFFNVCSIQLGLPVQSGWCSITAIKNGTWPNMKGCLMFHQNWLKLVEELIEVTKELLKSVESLGPVKQ